MADVTFYEPFANYGWIITKDHLAEDDAEVGILGPRNIRPEVEEALQAGKGHLFRMYDDDGILYFTGRTFVFDDATMNDEDEACYGPLGDFGMPGFGAVRIDYEGHPEWNCS